MNMDVATRGRFAIAVGLLTGVPILIAACQAGRRFRPAARQVRSNEPGPRDLLAVLAHELRTPLNSIVGWASVLQSGNADAETTEMAIRSIVSSAQTQRRLIEDIVDAMRAEQNEMPLRMAVLDLRSPVRMAIDIVRPAVERANLRLSVALPSSSCQVRGDAERLQQAFANVLTNAVKFTQHGSVHVSLKRRAGEYDVFVVDTGKGIPQEFLPLVFTRFQQAERSGRRHDGLGLGLAICQDLIGQHDGRIKVESDGHGRGTTVIISLPALPDTVASSA